MPGNQKKSLFGELAFAMLGFDEHEQIGVVPILELRKRDESEIKKNRVLIKFSCQHNAEVYSVHHSLVLICCKPISIQMFIYVYTKIFHKVARSESMSVDFYF